MHKHLILSLLLAAVSLSAAAQGDYERKLYKEAAGYQAVLYRGRQATSYTHISYNGHYFWLWPQFFEGSVSLNGKQYDDVLLNIDACEQQLLTKASESSPTIVIPRDRVTTFTIGDSKFVNLRNTDLGQNAADGFYQILRDGDEPIFFRVEKTIRTSPDSANGDQGIGYFDTEYKDEVLTAFIISRKYFILRSGKLRRVGANKVKKMMNGK